MAVSWAVAALLVCTSLTPADAASTAQAWAVTTASSGTWGAVATANTSAPYGSGHLVLTFPPRPGLSSYPPRFFTVGNSGTLPITAATYTATGAPLGASFTIEACSGRWDETANACPGTTSTIVSTSTSPHESAAVPKLAGEALRLRATVAAGSVAIFSTPTLTVGVSVSRQQVRPASTTGG